MSPILRSSRKPPKAQCDFPGSQGSQFSGFSTQTQQKAEDLLSPMQRQVAAWSPSQVRGTLLSPAAAAAFQASTSRSAPPPPVVSTSAAPAARTPTAAAIPPEVPTLASQPRFVVPPNIAGCLTPEQRTRWSKSWALARRKKVATASQAQSQPPAGPPSSVPSPPSSARPPSSSAQPQSSSARAPSSSTGPRLMPMPVPQNIKVRTQGSVTMKRYCVRDLDLLRSNVNKTTYRNRNLLAKARSAKDHSRSP